ncbi:hypothetical protein [Clostridium beijerinckii]|nr:hypothetical protein [Clostridium beijerinckii]
MIEYEYCLCKSNYILIIFDASEKEYLCIITLNQKYYDELDFEKVGYI